jgi:hypothetical protein
MITSEGRTPERGLKRRCLHSDSVTDQELEVTLVSNMHVHQRSPEHVRQFAALLRCRQFDVASVHRPIMVELIIFTRLARNQK